MWQKIKNYYHLLQALTASIIYQFPAKKLRVIGVTGTDGKTTTCHMIYEILKASGKKVSLISSLAAVIDNKTYNTGFHVTTPSPFALQKFLKLMVDKNCQFAVLEVTSHGLDQNRVAFIPFEIGVLTNITSEHLDYHKTFENYLKAKTKLFKMAKISILNVDDASFIGLKDKISGRLITYGVKNKAGVNLRTFPFKLKLVGDYNYYNALAAVATCKTLGVNPPIIRRTLEKFSGLAGRMEEVKNNLGVKIYIDFAHTPNSLQQTLQTLNEKRKTRNEKLIAVFGAAGERDQFKRPLMGEISAKLTDLTIITAEDPRSEDPKEIAKQIFEGCQKASGVLGKNVFIELDRKKAIKLAIKMAKKGDVVAIFGKGAEKSMAYNGREYPWSDRKAAESALKELNEDKF